MVFKKYSGIENSYRVEFIKKIQEEGFDKEQYVVQEKIHGANFSFYINKTKIKCAKRTGFITKDEKFFNYKAVCDFYSPSLRYLFDHINKFVPELEEVVVVGELFGGIYPHESIAPTNEGNVQKEVYYSNRQDFIAFDLKINGRFQPVDEANKLFDFANIPRSTTLFTGTLEECLKYPNSFESTIAGDIGLPEIPNNTCEGVVIRPKKVLYLKNGSRVMLKNKNDKFTEKRSVKARKPQAQLSSEILTAIDEVENYIVEARLRNVLSHLGSVTKKDFGKIMQAFTKDILEDFTKDHGNIYNILDKKDRKVITKSISSKAAKMISNNLDNIVDGNF